MILRDLGTWVGNSANLPRGYTDQDFYREAYHVREGLLVYLARSFDGSHFLPQASKVNVYFGPDRKGSDYSCSLSVANIWRNQFDFRAFCDAADEHKDALILQHLSAGLRDVAQRQGVPVEKVNSAEAEARSTGLYLRYAVKSLGRLHPNRKLRFDVIREMQRGSESWYLQVSDRSCSILETIPIDLDTYGVVAAAKYRKSNWRNETFVLTDSRIVCNFRSRLNVWLLDMSANKNCIGVTVAQFAS